MRNILFALLISLSLPAHSQEKNGAAQFWENLQTHCGKSYFGEITQAAADDTFRGKTLLMHVRACSENKVRIPFIVGEDKSRTWVLTYENDRIQLKHDHRHEDGSEDAITQYGGITTNTGLPGIQFFPADQQTSDLINYASNNVWWITLDETTFTYNLRRIGSDRLFSVSFDLTNPVENPEVPWGWED